MPLFFHRYAPFHVLAVLSALTVAVSIAASLFFSTPTLAADACVVQNSATTVTFHNDCANKSSGKTLTKGSSNTYSYSEDTLGGDIGQKTTYTYTMGNAYVEQSSNGVSRKITVSAITENSQAQSNNTSDNAKRDETYNQLNPSLVQFRDKFTQHSCSGMGTSQQQSQCADDAWKQAIYTCFTESTKVQTVGDHDKAMKSYFSTCLSGKLDNNVNAAAVADALIGVSFTSVQNSVDNAGANATDEEEGGSSCAVDGAGWLVCPAMSFLADITDWLFSEIGSYLEVGPDQTTNEATRSAWGVMRNIANVAFVIAFMFIIYSQITGFGISNYGVKKLLPRIIIAAILVNLSLIISQLAVDISNILGWSIKGLLENTGASAGVASMTSDASGNGWGVAAMIAVVLAAGTTALLAISGPVLFAAFIALVLIFAILLARKALIILLIVISPLAFVAFLLPNTEQWFKKWYKMFFSLLVVFPVISVVFGAAQLAGGIVKGAAGDDTGQQLIAIGVAAMPLFIVPSLLKGSLNATGALGASLSRAADSRQKAVTSKGRAKLGERYQNSRMADTQRALKRRAAESRARRRGNRASRYIDNSRIGKALGWDRGAAAAVEAVGKTEDEQVNATVTQFRSQYGATGLDEAQKGLTEAIKNNDIVTARAMQQYLLKSGGAGVKKLNAVYSDAGVSEVLNEMGEDGNRTKKASLMHRELAGDALASDIKTKSAAMDRYFTDSSGKSFTEHLNDKAVFNSLNPTQLSTQKNIPKLASMGHIDANMATAVLDNQNAAANLSLADRSILESIAGRKKAPGSNAKAGDASTSEGQNTSSQQTHETGQTQTQTSNQSTNSGPQSGPTQTGQPQPQPTPSSQQTHTVNTQALNEDVTMPIREIDPASQAGPAQTSQTNRTSYPVAPTGLERSTTLSQRSPIELTRDPGTFNIRQDSSDE